MSYKDNARSFMRSRALLIALELFCAPLSNDILLKIHVPMVQRDNIQRTRFQSFCFKEKITILMTENLHGQDKGDKDRSADL